MTIRRLIVYLPLFVFSSNLFSQHEDVATWISAGIAFDITDDISVDASEEMRYNISTADPYQLNTDIGLGFRFTKKIKIGFDYRYSIRRTADVNRIGFSIGFREGVKDFDFSIRSRIQYAFIPDQREGTAWRNKGTIKYEGVNDLTPYFAAELFYSFSNELNQFDNYRLEAGLIWEITKHHDLNGFYMFDKEFNVNEPITMHIFGLSYVYKF